LRERGLRGGAGIKGGVTEEDGQKEVAVN